MDDTHNFTEGTKPKSNRMPDLSDLSAKLIVTHGMNRFFRGVGPHNPPAIGLVSKFIRLVDKSVREYRFAREALEEYVRAHERRPRATLAPRSRGTI